MKNKMVEVLAWTLAVTVALSIISGFVNRLGQEKVKEQGISNEEIIRILKNSKVATNYDVTLKELLEFYYQSVKYCVYTKEEIKKAASIDTAYDNIYAECVDSSGNKFVFTWNIVYDETRVNGFDLIKKTYYDSITKKSYNGAVMHEKLQVILGQYLAEN